MPRVLLTTDEPNFTLGLVEGYRSLGWEVVTGVNNFRIRAAHYDLVHHQWPEEFSRWQIPGEREMNEIRGHLEWWKTRTMSIFSVNNLYPHQYDRNPVFHELYSMFYEHCQLISHYSHASQRLVLEEFPAAREAHHAVHSLGSYSVTLNRQVERGSRRSQMGIRDDEFVVLMVGSLRSWGEINLMRKAFDLADIPNKRLLMAGKVKVRRSPLREWLRFLALSLWLKRRKAVVDTRYVPEEEISQFVDSCDVTIVPRLSGLSSAIPILTMTFGKTVIAPDHGAYPEYLNGSRNFLYKTGSAESLARALEKASSLDLNEIGRENAVIAAKWTWIHVVRTCLEAVAQLDVATAEPIRVFLAKNPMNDGAC